MTTPWHSPASPNAMPHAPMELNPANIDSPANGRPVTPARFTQLFPETALFWDTPLRFYRWEHRFTSPH